MYNERIHDCDNGLSVGVLEELVAANFTQM